MPHAEAPQGSGEQGRTVAGPIIGKHGVEAHLHGTVVAQGGYQGVNGADRTFVFLKAGVGHAGVIVDGRMGVIPACTVGVLCAITGDPMAGMCVLVSRAICR